MSVRIAPLYSRASIALALFLALSAGCDSGGGDQTVSVGRGRDAGDLSDDAGMDEPDEPACDRVEIDGDQVIEHERDLSLRYRAGEPYTKTVMLFGGGSVVDPNVPSNAYVLGLDKMDALMLAEDFPDFYLCSSPGGQAAADLLRAYDLVPADCEVFEQLVRALRRFHQNRAAGGDRTSIQFQGAPLALEAVLDTSGNDVTDQVRDQVVDLDLHLVTSLEQLTGESVLSFGTSN